MASLTRWGNRSPIHPRKKQVTLMSLRANISNNWRNVLSTCDGSVCHVSISGALLTSRMWNQSSTSTLKMLSDGLRRRAARKLYSRVMLICGIQDFLVDQTCLDDWPCG